MIPTNLSTNVRSAVVDAITDTMPREHVASICRALLDDDDLPCALTFVYYGLAHGLRIEDAVLDGLAAWIDSVTGTKSEAARLLRLRAHELRIASLEKQLREAQAELWRAEHGVG